MFWGLIMEPQRRYTQTVKQAFHISMAALDISTSLEEPTQVMCGFEGRNYLLCTLQKGQIIQSSLDLYFEKGDEISFATNGQANVHLTGYLNDDALDFDDEEEEDMEEEELAMKSKRKRVKKSVVIEPPTKKSKTEYLLDQAKSEDDSDDSDVTSDIFNETVDEEDGEEEEDDEEVDEDDSEEEGDDEEDEDGSSLSEEEVEVKKVKQNGISKKEKVKVKVEPESPKTDKASKKAEKAMNEKQKENKVPKEEKNAAKGSPQKKTVEGGVIVEEIKQGNGAIAKPGKVVQVFYEGRFKNNNKMFDSSTKGAGFKFRLGRQEVIKGWDVGVQGMKVGGKRRITCPPNMAYGPKGSPPAIPPNSTLVFEVELKNIN